MYLALFPVAIGLLGLLVVFSVHIVDGVIGERECAEEAALSPEECRLPPELSPEEGEPDTYFEVGDKV